MVRPRGYIGTSARVPSFVAVRRNSRPAKELLAELHALGEDHVSARQLERLAEFGLLGPDGGEGGPALVERAREAIRLVHEQGSGDRAALVMFVRGYEFDRDRLIRAYMAALERIEAWIEKRSGGSDGLIAAAHIARKLAEKASHSAAERPMRERLKRMRRTRRLPNLKQALADVYTDALLAMTHGRASSEQGLRDLLEASGAHAITRDALPGKPPPAALLPIQAIKEMFVNLRLGQQAKIVAHATYAQLCTARDDTVALVQFARIFVPYVHRALGLPDAFGFAEISRMNDLATAFVIPVMVVLRTVKGHEIDNIRAAINHHTPRFVAMNKLLDQIPERFYPVAKTVASIEQLPADQHAELVAIVDEFEATYPVEYALIVSDVKPLPTVKYAS